MPEPKDYWRHVRDQDFTKSLDLSEPGKTIPLVWHTDGVKIYKNQKVWIYNYSSMVRKSGVSIENKGVLAIIRDSTLAKPQTHDTMAELIGWICKTLQTGRYPVTDWQGTHGRRNPENTNWLDNILPQVSGVLAFQLSKEIWKHVFLCTR